jgi:hypothetical protein
MNIVCVRCEGKLLANISFYTVGIDECKKNRFILSWYISIEVLNNHEWFNKSKEHYIRFIFISFFHDTRQANGYYETDDC